MPDAPCLICEEQSGAVPVPGGFLIDEPLVTGFHVPPLATAPAPYLGHFLVTPRRHTPSFGGLTASEGAAIGTAATHLTAALERFGATRVYMAVVGHAVEHLHVHLLPRYPETPPDVRWHEIDEWPGARRGGSREICDITATLVALLPRDIEAH